MEHTGYIRLSKRADSKEYLKKQIESLWRVNEGPLENIFRMSSYLIPFVPGFGWAIFALEKIASLVGYGLSDLGKQLDIEMHNSPGPNATLDEDDLALALEGVITKNDRVKTAGFNKEAGPLLLLLKMIGGPKKLAALLFKAVQFLVLLWGGTKIGDLYNSTFKNPFSDTATSLLNLSNKEKGDIGKMDPTALLNLPANLKTFYNI